MKSLFSCFSKSAEKPDKNLQPTQAKKTPADLMANNSRRHSKVAPVGKDSRDFRREGKLQCSNCEKVIDSNYSPKKRLKNNKKEDASFEEDEDYGKNQILCKSCENEDLDGNEKGQKNTFKDNVSVHSYSTVSTMPRSRAGNSQSNFTDTESMQSRSRRPHKSQQETEEAKQRAELMKEFNKLKHERFHFFDGIQPEIDRERVTPKQQKDSDLAAYNKLSVNDHLYEDQNGAFIQYVVDIAWIDEWRSFIEKGTPVPGMIKNKKIA